MTGSSQKSPLLKPLIPHYQQAPFADISRIFPVRQPLELEIGFGMGEFLVRSAGEFNERNYIGIEQVWERVYKTLKRIQRDFRGEVPNNLRVFYADAWIVLQRLIEPKSLSRAHAFFPCPWPKKKHVKHRLYSTDFLRLLNSRLVENGQARLVTDHERFYNWVLEESKGSGFRTETGRVKPQFDTKFERKWTEAGQKEFYEIRFHKTQHQEIPLIREEQLRTFQIDHFDPESFAFRNITDEPAVIFRDYVYDPLREKAVVHLIVSEDHLQQHLRVTIQRKDGSWRVFKTDGQHLFPTPGIKKAIAAVYETAANKST